MIWISALLNHVTFIKVEKIYIFTYNAKNLYAKIRSLYIDLDMRYKPAFQLANEAKCQNPIGWKLAKSHRS